MFRKAAVEASRGSQYGDALNQQWGAIFILTLISAAAVGTMVLALLFIGFAPQYRVRSLIEHSTGTVEVRAETHGRIVDLLVADGALIHKDDPVLAMEADAVLPDGRSTLQAQLEISAAESMTIEQRLKALALEQTANSDMNRRTKLALQKQLDHVQSSVVVTQRFVQSLQEQQKSLLDLSARGFLSSAQLAEKELILTEQQLKLKGLQAESAKLANELAQVGSMEEISKARFMAAGNELRSASLASARSILSLRSDARRQLVAPANGVIAMPSVRLGDSVIKDQVIFRVVPIDKGLTAKLFVPSYSMSAISVGKEVSIGFDAYPAQHFGYAKAIVQSVSATSIAPPPEAESNQPVFVVLAEIDQKSMPGGVVIKSGMGADVRVSGVKKSAMEWVFSPILRALK